MKVVIAGGGTGGHIFPAVAIGHALQRLRPGTELLFVGAKGKMEMEKIPQEGFPIIGLDIAGFNRSNLLKNISLPFKLWKSRQQANKVIRDFAPDAVVGVGGFASFPMLNAAQAQGIPTLIQEQNSFAGKSNKLLGKKAKAVCVAYEGMERFFPKDRIIITGNPVRASIAQSNISKEEGLAAFGLSPDRETILIVGGSLGARSINEAIAQHIQEIAGWNVQLIWQTGKLFIEEAKKVTAPLGKGMIVQDFIRNMEYAYAAADVVISRAGALASAELCIAGKPVIFVPYPFAAEDHQTSNALALVEHNAAMMVKDNETRTELVRKLHTLLGDDNMRQIMAANIQKHGIKDADERIARKVIEICGQ
ncbi:undecaprenyldiphospho-muramoylpentapeptide beta-N-acetylglucosaminyltransferase [Taibaiella helva]|uniref:undecaprenyldiphospho-muramoylpentapeptide beta-N-acetylglucosaminyltransferase n=1 Tax=Taibaiella helva TaxID=2301235 RepID=UPI000E576B0B|nr:undecaprenyldiphospho-muramoylpentapeptide beta-N-acetylglucosaminyltransferase [Taibaiella helva]